LYFNGTQLELMSGLDKEALVHFSRYPRGLYLNTLHT